MLSQRLMYRLHREFLDNTILHNNVPLFISIRKNTNDVNEKKDLIVNKDNPIDKVNKILDVNNATFKHRMEQNWKYRWILNDDKSGEFTLLPVPPSNRYSMFQIHAPPLTSFGYGGVKGWLKKMMIQRLRDVQRFTYERHSILGCDLAAAHFIVHLGGKVRFQGHEKWITLETKDELPENFHPDYKLVEADVSNVPLCYEGLDNFYGLVHLRWLSLRGSPYFNDWCLDKLSSQFPSIEYLDISDCKKITERGLEALYRMNTLKTLIVTNYHKNVAFELSCLMLEDCIPGLSCVITIPQNVETKEKTPLIR